MLPLLLMAVLQALSIVSFFRLAESDVRDLKARTSLRIGELLAALDAL